MKNIKHFCVTSITLLVLNLFTLTSANASWVCDPAAGGGGCSELPDGACAAADWASVGYICFGPIANGGDVSSKPSNRAQLKKLQTIVEQSPGADKNLRWPWKKKKNKDRVKF